MDLEKKHVKRCKPPRTSDEKLKTKKRCRPQRTAEEKLRRSVKEKQERYDLKQAYRRLRLCLPEPTNNTRLEKESSVLIVNDAIAHLMNLQKELGEEPQKVEDNYDQKQRTFLFGTGKSKTAEDIEIELMKKSFDKVRYKKELNQSYEKLRLMLPETEEGASRVLIVNDAIEYINNLQRELPEEPRKFEDCSHNKPSGSYEFRFGNVKKNNEKVKESKKFQRYYRGIKQGYEKLRLVLPKTGVAATREMIVNDAIDHIKNLQDQLSKHVPNLEQELNSPCEEWMDINAVLAKALK